MDRDEDATSVTSEEIRERLTLALDNMKSTSKPACPYLSSEAKHSLKQFKVVLPGSQVEIKRYKDQYVSELFKLYNRKQQTKRDHVYNVVKDARISPLQKLRLK
jgi:hypothetical protein